VTSDSAIERLFRYAREAHPRSLAGLDAARDADPVRFERIATACLAWGEQALGENALATMFDAFVDFCTSVTLSQARYEAAGHYASSSFDECYEELYGQLDEMRRYLWGVYLTNFLWVHHLDIFQCFDERFIPRLSPQAEIVEVAFGHGGWGTWLMHRMPEATLRGFDISPAAVEVATQLTQAAGFADRTEYSIRNALDLGELEPEVADAVVCCFLLEHLENPAQLVQGVHHLLRPRGFAFLTGGLTAAQEDHIFEFVRESELVALAEDAGLRVLETLSVGPERLLPNARYMPRSMALIVQKRHTDSW